MDGFEEVEIPDPDPTDPTTPDAPSMTWPANPTFATMELAETMDVKLNVKAPGKIKTFVVVVESAKLGEYLPSMISPEYVGDDGTCTLDLINDPTAVTNLSGVGMKTGTEIKGQTEVEFDLSGLVPMIFALSPESGSKHIFTLDVSDEYNQAYSGTLTFVMP